MTISSSARRVQPLPRWLTQDLSTFNTWWGAETVAWSSFSRWWDAVWPRHMIPSRSRALERHSILEAVLRDNLDPLRAAYTAYTDRPTPPLHKHLSRSTSAATRFPMEATLQAQIAKPQQTSLLANNAAGAVRHFGCIRRLRWMAPGSSLFATGSAPVCVCYITHLLSACAIP
jgi:hypothetical protein